MTFDIPLYEIDPTTVAPPSFSNLPPPAAEIGRCALQFEFWLNCFPLSPRQVVHSPLP